MADIPEGCIVPEGFSSWYEAVIRLAIGTGRDEDQCERLLDNAITWDRSVRSWLPEPPLPYPARTLAYIHAEDLEKLIEKLNGRPPPSPPKTGGAPPQVNWQQFYLKYFLPEYRKHGEPSREKPEHWRTVSAVANWVGDKVSDQYAYEEDHLRKVVREKLLKWAKQGITSFAQ